MTLEITRPETEARIQRYLQSGRFHDLDELLTKALDALPEPAAPLNTNATGAANLVELFEPVRGLLTDEEIDTIFSRNRSPSRPVDLS
jgi:hypothetical protein